MNQLIRLKNLILVPLLLVAGSLHAQYKISGTVLDDKEKPVKGANVYLDNTIDGATTDSLGAFHFTTSESGNQTIVASEVSHENTGMPIVITGDMSGILLHMKANKAHSLDEVVITAGSFDASNDKSKTVLKPLDIVTTAGANADVVKAMETLPGTQKAGTENGLFVRGGDASEAAILVDEMVVQNAFFSGAPGVATRSRFGAFQYQGVSFSSGGYSAKYGQALSSVLELNSTDIADKSTVNLGANTAGVYASGTKKWKKASLDIGGSYNNLTPFYKLATTNYKFYKVPEGGMGNLRYIWKPNKDGILKVAANVSYTSNGVSVPNPYADDTTGPMSGMFHGDTINYLTKDQYYYTNISYNQMFKSKYRLYTAASYSYDLTNNSFGPMEIKQNDHRAQFRIEGKDYFTSRLNLLVGSDIQNFGITKEYNAYYKPNFTETLVSGYTELEWTPINVLAIRPGARYEHSTLLNADKIAPRLSMAIKTSAHSQVSLAGGMFYQNADNVYLLSGFRPDMQEATHYIANWQWSKDARTLRLEGYYKKYDHLLLEHGSFNPNPYRQITDSIDNSGYGYAKGLELFWRDKKTIKNADYWISYSYIDTRRKYNNFPTEATPTYIADHNLNVVAKYFVNKIQTNFSATYSYASGRPYFNPYNNSSDYSKFLSDKTPDYHNLAISIAYLHTFGKWFTVFYVAVDNITNYHNVFGYRYNYDPNGHAAGAAQPIVPALYRTIFFGVNCSLTQFSKDEL